MKDQVDDDYDEVPLLAQYLEGFVVALIFQESMAKLVSFVDALTQV